MRLALVTAAGLALPSIANAQDKDSKPIPPKDQSDIFDKKLDDLLDKKGLVKPKEEKKDITESKKLADEKEVKELLAAYKETKPKITEYDAKNGPHIYEYLLLQNLRKDQDTSQLPKELREELEKEIQYTQTGDGGPNRVARHLKILKIYLEGEKRDNARLPEQYSNALDEADRVGKTIEEIRKIDKAYISLSDSSKFTIVYYQTFIEMLEHAYGIYPRKRNLDAAKENYQKYIGKVNLDNKRLLITVEKGPKGEPSMKDMLEIFLKSFKEYMSKNGIALS